VCDGYGGVYGAFRFYGFEADSLSVCDKIAAGPGARCGSGQETQRLRLDRLRDEPTGAAHLAAFILLAPLMMSAGMRPLVRRPWWTRS
jgi:hypothetical protein